MAATVLAVYETMPLEPEGSPLQFTVVTAPDLIELSFVPGVIPEESQTSLEEDAKYKLSVGKDKDLADDAAALQELWLFNKSFLTGHATEFETVEQARARAEELIAEGAPYAEETAGD